MIDETSAYLMIGTLISIWAFSVYKLELRKFACPMDFWRSKTQGAFTGPEKIIVLILWNVIVLLALPTGIIWRLITWRTKSSKS